MPISTLLNGLSVGDFGNIQAPTLSPNAFRPPVSVNKIDAKMRLVTQNEVLHFPEDTPTHFMKFEVANYSRSNLLTVGTLNPIATIVLPIPLSLRDGHNVSYKTSEVGQVGGVLTGALSIGEAVKGMKTGFKDTDLSIEGMTKSISDVGKQIGKGLAGGAAGGGAMLAQSALAAAQKAASQIGVNINAPAIGQAFLGYSPNQFLTILLEGPRYKEYRFEWLLAPKNEQESASIKEIIRSFNNYMAPGLAAGGAIFTFPKIFKPAIMPNSRYMYKFKPSVLQGMEVNYTGGGQAAFYRESPALGEGGRPPESVQLSMSFMELEFWLTGDFKDNNDPYDTAGPNH